MRPKSKKRSFAKNDPRHQLKLTEWQKGKKAKRAKKKIKRKKQQESAFQLRKFFIEKM